MVGWISLNSYSDVANLSIYIYREQRGKGIGERLLNGRKCSNS
ncbi:hypothetical protein ACFTSE_08450 [Bacillus cereus]